jgi:hypothetical protein
MIEMMRKNQIVCGKYSKKWRTSKMVDKEGP